MEQPYEPEAGISPSRDVYTISRLNREVRSLLDKSFPLLWVEGEVSNLSRPSSGHLYFSLKDRDCQVRCAMFKMKNMYLQFIPKDGMHVLVRARIGLYEPRGDFQLIVEHMEAAGEGALRLAFEQLKKRLSAEGLFEAAHKQPLPAFPQQIGVITSPSGAAIRDILSVLRRRFPAIPVLIYPVPVQGAGAAPQIARMISLASARKECDVLILARGGGSLEDLWPFNEEIVARAIYDCEIPLVSGVGHEVDVTIADFVADLRAPTPTGAAELVSPDAEEWLQRLYRIDGRLNQLIAQRHTRMSEKLQWLMKRLEQRHPGQALRRQAQFLDEQELRLRRALQGQLRHASVTVSALSARLHRHMPLLRLEHMLARNDALCHRLHSAVRRLLDQRTQELAGLGRALDAVSPLSTLGRGYAIIRRSADGAIVRNAQVVNTGEQIEARVAQGRLICTVDETHSK